MKGLPMPPQPKISPVAWAMTMPWTFSVPAWMTTPDHGQDQWQLVGDQLAGCPQATQQ